MKVYSNNNDIIFLMGASTTQWAFISEPVFAVPLVVRELFWQQTSFNQKTAIKKVQQAKAELLTASTD